MDQALLNAGNLIDLTKQINGQIKGGYARSRLLVIGHILCI